MSDSNNGKISYVDSEGRTFVDVNALLRNPKVRETVEKMSKASERDRGKPGIAFVRPLKSRG